MCTKGQTKMALEVSRKESEDQKEAEKSIAVKFVSFVNLTEEKNQIFLNVKFFLHICNLKLFLADLDF
jgi:hypothetical protein